MFCSKCGNKISDGDLFCAVCGQNIRRVKPKLDMNAFKRPEQTESQTFHAADDNCDFDKPLIGGGLTALYDNTSEKMPVIEDYADAQSFSAENENIPSETDKNDKSPFLSGARRTILCVCASAVFTLVCSYGAYRLAYEKAVEDCTVTEKELDRANDLAKDAYEIVNDYYKENNNMSDIYSYYDSLYSMYNNTYDLSEDTESDLGKSLEEHFKNEGVSEGKICVMGYLSPEYYLSSDSNEDIENYYRIVVQWQSSEELGEQAVGQYPEPVAWKDHGSAEFGSIYNYDELTDHDISEDN